MSALSPLPLEGDLGLRDAPALAERLLASVTTNDSIVIDASRLTGADVTIVQLLVSAHKTASRLNKPISLVGAEAGLRSALERLGLAGPAAAFSGPEADFLLGRITPTDRAPL